jgi:hypothetical protein
VSRPHRTARGALALGLILALAPLTAPAGAGGTVRLERRWSPFVGKVNVKYARLALDVSARVAYVFSQDVDTNGPVIVQPWHLDRLTPLAPPLSLPGLPDMAATTPIAIDESTHTLVFSPVPQITDAAAAAPPVVEVLALRNGAMTEVAKLMTRHPAGYSVLGFAVEPTTKMLVDVAGPAAGGAVPTAGAGTGGIQVDTWRLADLAAGRIASPDPAPIAVPNACGQVITTDFAAGLLMSADGKTAYFGCLTNKGALTLTGPNATDYAGVAELDLAAARSGLPTALTLAFVPGNFVTGDSLVVPAQRRVILLAEATTTTNAKVYDTRHHRYVGNVGIEDLSVGSVGVHPVTGRGYYVIGAGLGVFDPAATPATQGTVHEDLSPIVGGLTRPMEIDPRTSRVFIPTSDDLNSGDPAYVAVLRDRTPLPSLDTQDVEDSVDAPEKPGVTESIRSADAAAVGVEYRLVGGPYNASYNATHADAHLLVRPGTRVQQFAAARNVRLTGTEAAAEVVASRRDDATASDAFGVGALDATQCSDFSGTPTGTTASGLKVACDVAREMVHAEVATDLPRLLVGAGPGAPKQVHDHLPPPPSGAPPPPEPPMPEPPPAPDLPVPVQVGSAAVTVDLRRAAPRGALTSVLSTTASGVDILGIVRIGRVTASLETAVHGRPGTAAVKYTRAIYGVTVNGVPVCDTQCSLDDVAATVNRALGGRGHVEFPPADEYEARTGAAARLTDDRYRHVERVLLDDVPDDNVLRPAMEIVVNRDATSASRHVVTLAALSAQSRYRIFRLTPPPTFPPPPTPTNVAALPRVPVATPAGTGRTTTTTTRTKGTPGTPTVIGDPTPPGLLGAIDRHVRVILRNARDLAGIAAVWSLLAVPVYLSARRRLLLELPRLRPETP